MSDDSAELNVDSDDEGFKTKKTVGFKTVTGQHFEKDNFGKELEDMDKDELIDLIISGGQKELRNTNYSISLIRERMTHFERAIKELEESIKLKKKKAEKYRAISGDEKRSIKAIERIIENNQKRIEELQKKVKEFEDKKKKKAVEQINAKKEITKKLVNGLYKYFEKETDLILVRLVEAFVACLRNTPSASKEDVEIYFRKYDGLMWSLNKVDTRKISGGNAKIYSDTVQAIRNEFKGDTKYAKYIPFLVFLNQTCSIVSLSVEERQIENEIENLEEDIKLKEKEIDEIETFHKHVDEMVDYDALVQQEEEQLKLLTNHYSILEARLKKLWKYSRLFQRYFFTEISDKKKLYSSKLERIDTMDDIENIEQKERTAGNLVKSLTKVVKAPPKESQRKFDESKEKTKNDQSSEDSAERSEEDNEERSDEEDEGSQRSSRNVDEEED